METQHSKETNLVTGNGPLKPPGCGVRRCASSSYLDKDLRVLSTNSSKWIVFDCQSSALT